MIYYVVFKFMADIGFGHPAQLEIQKITQALRIMLHAPIYQHSSQDIYINIELLSD